MNTKMILVFDDDERLRPMLARMLEGQGFTTLQARSAPEVLDLLRTHPGKIHLLMAPVQGPEMPGVKLAKRAQDLRPDTKVMLLADREAFLGRPFTLALKVWAMLEPLVER